MSAAFGPLEAAVRAAYDRCGYRRAQGTWAGGKHEVRVEVIDPEADEKAALDAAAAADTTARLIVQNRALSRLCEALGPRATLDLLAPARENARLTADEGAERRRAELRACAALEGWDEESVFRSVRRSLTSGAPRPPSQPDAVGESSSVWSRNRKWRGRNSTHTLRVRPDWRQRVEARGCAVVRDGPALRLALDCDKRRGNLYHVLVVLPGRGFALRTEWRWAEAASPAAQGARA